ncbi:hypothetical protein D3C85_1647680 [compost metagenome]
MGGGGVGVFPVHFAGQAVTEVIRDQQGVGDVRHQLRLLFHQGAQLIESIKGQKLDAAAPVDVGFAELFNSAGHHAVGPAVAIGNGQADAVAVTVEQDKIDAPGIDADAVD